MRPPQHASGHMVDVINIYTHAGNKTKPHSQAAAEGAEPDLPVADALNARRDGKRDAMPHKPRPQRMHGLPEHFSPGEGRRADGQHHGQREDHTL